MEDQVTWPEEVLPGSTSPDAMPTSGRRSWLAGRRAAVVGAAGEVGRAIAFRLAGEGAALALLDRDGDGAAVIAKELSESGLRAAAFTLDLRDEAQVAAIMGETEAWLDGLDVLVHVAAAPSISTHVTDQLSSGHWAETLGGGLYGTMLLARYSIPALRRSGNGALLLVGPSDNGGSLPDGVRMAGVHGLAVSLDRQLRDVGVRVLELTVPTSVLNPERRGGAADGMMENLAATVAFAASDEGASIVGTVRTA